MSGARLFGYLAIAAVLCGLAFAQMPQPPAPWAPPVAIPAPPFGINETPGAITHYVNNTHPLATDTDNPNGTPARPRLSVPTTLPAGSVVEVRGGPYSIGDTSWNANGTPSSPVFVVGEGNPVFRGGGNARIVAVGANFIIEGIVLEGIPLNMAPAINRFAFRRSTVRNFSPGRNASAVAIGGSDVVIFGNEIHHNGDPNSPTEIDLVGVFAMPGSLRAWIVDNHIHHNGGDAVLVGAATSSEPWARFIYIGRNVMHEDRENGVDIKQSRDVLVSQNLIGGYVLRSSSLGESVVTHNGAERILVLNNFISTSQHGVVSTGANSYGVVGNSISNIRHTPGDGSYNPTDIYRSAGILTYSTSGSVHTNNTIWGSDAGISYAGTAPTQVMNNIIGALSQPSHHIAFESSAGFNAASISHNLLHDGPRVRVSGQLRDCSAFANCSQADPQFVDVPRLDFRLRPGSPAIDAGTNAGIFYVPTPYGTSIDRDLLGAPRLTGSAYDLGAFEFQPGGSPVPPVPPGPSPPPPPTPRAPTDLAVTSEFGRVRLSWSAVADASSYRIKRSQNAGGPYTVISTVTAGSYLDTDVVAGTTYYYIVTAVNASGESAASAEVHVTASAPVPPPMPEGLRIIRS